MLDSVLPTRSVLTSDVPETAIVRVLRQWLEALLFEGCLDGIAVPDNVNGGHTFYFIAGRGHFSCKGHVRGFGRISLDMKTLATLRGAKKHSPPSLEMLYGLLDAIPGDMEAKRRLGNELLQTLYWTQWNQQHLPNILRRDMDFAELEIHLREGHPYHPCFKARSGFSEADHRQYSSDCGEEFQLRWLAVRRRNVRWNLGSDRSPEDFHREQGNAALADICRLRGQDPDEYFWIPVHPWQWRNYLRNRLPDISTGDFSDVLDLGPQGDFYRASQSQRTLMNVSRPGAADIKLPLNIVCTSSLRHLLSHSLCAAPIISNWLAQTTAGDDFFAEHPLIILQEFAGVIVDPEIYNPDGDRGVSQFSAIWRDNITSFLLTGERAVPMTALLATEMDGMPFIQGWIEHYGLTAWLEQLMRVVILPVWHLLVRHGFAVEAHAQNAILIHRDGWPVRLALRDFHESFEYVPEFVAEPGSIPDFAALDATFAGAPPNQFYWMDRVDALRELYMDTLYIFHFSDLAALCARHYDLAEPRFWQMVGSLHRNYAASGYCTPERLQQITYCAPKIRAESLVRKKLWNHPAIEYHHWVENPLAKDA